MRPVTANPHFRPWTAALLLLASFGASAAEYPLESSHRPLTLPANVLVLGVEPGLSMRRDVGYPFSALKAELLARAGITDSIQLTLPLVLHVAFGDRTGNSLEYAAFGGVRRVGFRRSIGFFPTVGISARKLALGGAFRVDLEFRGTSAIRLGSMSGEARADVSWIRSLGSRLSLGLSIGATGFLQSERYPLRSTLPFGGTVSFGSTEETPLLRLHAAYWLDIDAQFRVTPFGHLRETYAGLGLRFIVGRERAPATPASSPAPAAQTSGG